MVIEVRTKCSGLSTTVDVCTASQKMFRPGQARCGACVRWLTFVNLLVVWKEENGKEEGKMRLRVGDLELEECTEYYWSDWA